MKKTILSVFVLSAVSASAAADLKVDLYNESETSGDRSSKQGVIIGYGQDTLIGSVFGEVEVTTNTDIELTGGMKFDLTDNFYLKPNIAYVFNGENNKKSSAWNTSDSFEDQKLEAGYKLEATGLASDIVKVALEAGMQFESGFYASARYRIEQQIESTKVKESGFVRYTSGGMDPEFNDVNESFSKTVFKGEKSRTGRTDLTAGFAFDYVTIQGKAIHKYELNKHHFNRKVYGTSGRWGSELKATLTTFDGIAPYLQLSSDHTYRKGFDDNKVKLGMEFVF
ncbi:hypothetical protein [Vibrio alfacsensis]|uniref:hypothetical protein n=1 Tax=Vibrio alfacsensis TaxID=1074311 RepID=UPI001BEDCFE2|nr:hypothetical protein [Vibrio alfacsensis]BCN26398.1 hypothetical protein VYA_35900 [Vibrio alfacsensis]